MAKRQLKLLLTTNNQIIIGTLVDEPQREGCIKLYDTTHLQADQAGKYGLALHDLNGLVKSREPQEFQLSALTMVASQDSISDDLVQQYTQWASGIQQPTKPTILLKG